MEIPCNFYFKLKLLSHLFKMDSSVSHAVLILNSLSSFITASRSATCRKALRWGVKRFYPLSLSLERLWYQACNMQVVKNVVALLRPSIFLSG